MTHAYGDRFEAALAYAAAAHASQRRKGGDVPYVGHLLAVAGIAIESGASEDEAIAALLHDAVEDQGGAERLADVRARFGGVVAGIVAECSDTDEIPKPPWRPRKEAYVAHLATASPGAVRVSLADKIHNARAILYDHRLVGRRVWDRFSASAEDTLWYYRALVSAFTVRIAGDRRVAELAPLAAELDRVVAELEELAGVRDWDGGLRIVGSGGARIESLGDWLLAAPPAGGLKQWRDGHSAKELARAWVGGGRAAVPEAYAELLASRPETSGMRLGLVRPEQRIPIDAYSGHTRNTDLVVHGTAAGGRTYIAVEAKNDEPFGATVGVEWPTLAAMPGSHLRDRIRELTQLVLGADEPLDEISHQLLHSLAGTVIGARSRGAAQAVFVVHEFRTDETSDADHERNALALRTFLARLAVRDPPGGRLARVPVAGAPDLPTFVGKIETSLRS